MWLIITIGFASFFHLDARSAARAGMLHDLFLYDWRGHRKKTGDPVHAMTTSHRALHNAKKYFHLNPLEEEMIVKHMFPVTPIPPCTGKPGLLLLRINIAEPVRLGVIIISLVPERRVCLN